MIDTVIVGIYLLGTLFLGWFSARGVKTDDDYATGGRSYTALLIFATLSASFIGGGFTIGLAEKTYQYGILYVIALCGFSLKEILLAHYIAPKMDQFAHAKSVGDIVEQAFGTKAKIFSGLASICVCGGVIGAQIAVCGDILYTFFGVPEAFGSCVAMGIVIFYAALGGMKSVVFVGIIHFCVLTTVLPLTLVFGLPEVGFDTFITQLQQSKILFSREIGLLGFCILFASFFLGETLIPPYVQRLLIGKTSEETRKGTLASGLFSIPFFALMGATGVIAFILDPAIEPQFALPYTIKTVMPVGLKGIAIAAMLAIVMSSADAFLNATSIAVRYDVLDPIGLNVQDDSKHSLLLSRLITLVVGLVAITFALMITSILDILLYAYQFWTPVILIPLTAAIYGVKASPSVFFTAALASIVVVVMWNITGMHISHIDGALEAVIIGMIVNTVTFFTGLWLSNYYRQRTQTA